ncbi:MAG: type II secretion system protein [Acidimicrobiales bacterium]
MDVGQRDMWRESGFGLISMLVVLVILGSLAVITMKGLDQLGKSTATVTGTGTGSGGGGPVAPTPGLGLVAIPPDAPVGGPTGRVAGPSGPRPVANAAACKGDYASVQHALALTQATAGPPVASVADLVTRGVLAAAPSNQGYTIELRPSPGQPLPEILVNGQPGIAGCG